MRFEAILAQRQSLTNLLFSYLPVKAQSHLVNKTYKPAEEELICTLSDTRSPGNVKQAAAYFLAAIYSTEGKKLFARMFYNQVISMDRPNLLSTLALMELAIMIGQVNHRDALPLIEQAANLGNLEAEHLLFNLATPENPPMPAPLTAQI